MKCYSRVFCLVVAGALVSSCRSNSAPHDHGDEHPEGHNHHENGHGHGETPMLGITRWSEEHELFAEHAPAIVGQETRILAHLTILEDFAPLEGASLRLELEGPAPLRTTASTPVQPGIYDLVLTPTAAGKYKGRLVIDGSSHAIEDIELQVYASAEDARSAAVDAEDTGLIELLKEQQWAVPFATTFAREDTLVASIVVAGTVDTPPGGSAEVGAPVAGRVVAPPKGLPRPGDVVKKGQLLASLAPAPSSPEEAARTGLAVAEAEARAAAARAALERAERLIRDEAISQRELEDARREVHVGEESVRAARDAAALFSGASAGGNAGSWRLVAPIDGVLAEVDATPGASVAPGTVLFHIVDGKELWIRARVPEQDAARLRTDRDAHYQIAGLDSWRTIDLTGDDATASVVTVGRTVDPVSRTVDIIYSLSAPEPALRVGGLVQVGLPVAEDFTGIVVPTTAIVDEDGRSVVYVQVDGEHFAERAVRPAARSGALSGIDSGLRAGERIVTRGAHVVRLADRSSSSVGHGHIH